jgi:hypothetical protein
VTVYELRTRTLHVGKMADAIKLCTEHGHPAINHLVHLWKCTDDTDRRAHWPAVYASNDLIEGFAVKFRPLVASQEVKLWTAPPWGTHP